MGTYEKILGLVGPYANAIDKKRQRDGALTYGELRQVQAVGNTDSPTNKMSPNTTIPGMDNPAVTGVVPANNGGNTAVNETTQTAPKMDSYDKLLQYLEANRKEDADAEIRAKRNETFAAIGDGISALSSLYQTTKGAPVTYTHGDDMSKVMRDRYDRMIADRKASSDRYMNYLRVQAAKEAAEENREYKRMNQEIRQQQLEESARAAKEREEARKEALQLQKDREARIAKVQDLNIEMRKAKDPGLRIYYGTKANLINEGWPEDKAEAAALAEQEKHNAAQKAAKSTQKKSGTKKKRRGNRGSGGGSQSGGIKYTNTRRLNY